MDTSLEVAPTHPPDHIQTPSRKTTANSHRLLYRGSLALPDSHLPLDGLSFTTNIAEIRPGNSPSTLLLENPLALGLESMRGRPLHLKGTEKLQDTWLDTAVEINVHVHQYSMVTHIYFQNIFCLYPIISLDRRTSTGIRVGLSDTSAVDDFLIYGELRQQSAEAMDSLPSSPSKAPETLCILAARILLHPPARIPRPDDPTPRKPPAYVSGNSAKRKRDLSSTNLDLSGSSKRAKGKGRADNEDEQVRLARETMLYMPKPGVSLPRMLGRDVRPGRSTDEFKIPALPSRAQSQPVGKLNGSDVADVFGSVDSGSVKEKEHATDSKPGSDELEKANKTVIKQAAITCLSKHGVKKGHPEFNDLFTATYRGAAFALRNVVRVQAVNMRSVDKLLEAHARIYVNGNGDNHTSTSGS